MSPSPLAPRADFPALATSRQVYLDNAATTQVPRRVLDALVHHYSQGCANVGRGVYAWAERATADYEGARAKVAAYFGADPGQLVFTSGTTESLNLVAQGWGRAQLRRGDRLVVTPLEHHANFLPWQALAAELGTELEQLRCDDRGELDLDDAAAKLEGARLLAVTAASNVLGARVPVEHLSALARARGVVTVVDAAQVATHPGVSLAAFGCDFLACSGHKMLGPTGIGVLLGRPERLAEIEPTRLGGGMVAEVAEVAVGGAGRSTWRELPARLEGGTPNIAGAVGLGAAVDYIEGLGRERVADHARALVEALVTGLREVPGCALVGPTTGGLSLVSFVVEPHHPHDLASLLDERGVAVRAGLHCAQPLIRRLGLNGTIRASFAPYNGGADVEALLEGLRAALEVLG